MDGRLGVYREQDEVILANILKDSKLSIPPSKYYPRDLRGLHLGDFKFSKRWTNPEKMSNYLTDGTIKSFLQISTTKDWLSTVKTLQDSFLNVILERVDTYIKGRKNLGA
jgi:hypothetical protein